MSNAKAKGTRVPPWIAAWIIGEAAKGLHYAHEKKDEGGAPLEIVHRDVSPQNILLSFEGAVKIADFGIASAKLFSEEAGVLKGKFGYMSPEQARAEKVDRRSDLYALGVIFWEILAGRPLHGGLGGEALLDIVRSGVVEPPTHVRPDDPGRAREDRDAGALDEAGGSLPDRARAADGDRAGAAREARARRCDDARADDRAAGLARSDAPGRERPPGEQGRRRAERGPSDDRRRAGRAELVGGLPERPSPRRDSHRARFAAPHVVANRGADRAARGPPRRDRDDAPGRRHRGARGGARAREPPERVERDRLQAEHPLAVDVAGRRARRRGHHLAREPRRRRRCLARARHPRSHRRDEGRPAHADRRRDRHRPRDRVRVARPGGEPRSVPPARSGRIPRRYDQRRDAALPDVGRGGGLPARAARVPLGGRADAPAQGAPWPRRPSDDADLCARAEPLARRAPRRGVCGGERPGGARSGEGGSPGGLP